MRNAAIRLTAITSLAIAAFLKAQRPRRRQAHRSETSADYERAKTRILILGGGFGGATAAIELDRQLRGVADLSILLVDRANAQVFVPLLWSVAAGSASPASVTVPLRTLQRGRAFHVLNAEVEGIDLEERVVHTSAGDRNYDILIVALGSVTTVPDLPGVREHVHIFRGPADAVELRNYLIDAIERAHRATDPAEHDAWRTFVVAGGGDTGCELAAAIDEYIRGTLRKLYPWLVAQPPRIVVVQRDHRLVPLSPPRVSTLLRAHLEAQGIEVQTGVSVERITDDGVHTSASTIPTRTVFWATGVSAPDVVRTMRAAHEKNGALTVDGCLRLPGHPNVYAIGDNAWALDGVTGAPVPALAQAAEHQAQYVARTVAASLRGEPSVPFEFTKVGQLTLLGGHDGIVEIGRITITGLPAWLAWHAYYLLHIDSWRNRILLAADWLLTTLVGRESSQLRLHNERSTSPENARTG
ncbi:MAG: NAD(P)/FAD-dependent oxidoreductase [Candidatus Velthaea sp.]